MISNTIPRPEEWVDLAARDIGGSPPSRQATHPVYLVNAALVGLGVYSATLTCAPRPGDTIAAAGDLPVGRLGGGDVDIKLGLAAADPAVAVHLDLPFCPGNMGHAVLAVFGLYVRRGVVDWAALHADVRAGRDGTIAVLARFHDLEVRPLHARPSRHGWWDARRYRFLGALP